jgi:HK97 family phage portal protein
MGWIDNLRNWLGGQKATTSAPRWWAGVAEEYRYAVQPDRIPTSLYQKLTWIATAVDVAASVAASTPLQVFQDTADGERNEVPGHEFARLWRRPNPLQTPTEFVRDALSWYKMTGNLYIWMNATSETDAPDELWILPSDKVKPQPDGNMFVSGYWFDIGTGSPYWLKHYEIAHIKTFNPANPFVGLSALQSLIYTANVDIAEQRWSHSLFADDNAKLPGMLAFADRYADPQWEELKAQAKENWGGTRRSGPMMMRGVGPQGVTWINMGATQKEMEFLESRISNRDEIWQKLAPGLANVLDVNATEANATAGKAVLLEFTIRPMHVALAEKITANIMPRYGDGLSVEFEDVRETNRLIDLQEQNLYHLTHTVAEARREYYGDDPLGDERDSLLVAEVGKAQPQSSGAAERQAPPTAAPDGESVTDAAKTAELQAWERYALKRLGKPGGREFEPRVLDIFAAARIKAALKLARNADDVHAVFERERNGGGNDLLAAAVAELRRYNDGRQS